VLSAFEHRLDRTARTYLSLAWAEPRPASANPDSSPPSVVSAKHLRHKVPKAAMKAYKNGEKLSRQHHPDKASQELEQAIAVDPDFSDAHGDLGVQYAAD